MFKMYNNCPPLLACKNEPLPREGRGGLTAAWEGREMIGGAGPVIQLSKTCGRSSQKRGQQGIHKSAEVLPNVEMCI